MPGGHGWGRDHVPPSRNAVRTLLPTRAPHEVERPRLQRSFDANDAALTLVCASAGTGKTTALAQWARSRPRRVAWLTLTPEDNDATTFHADVASAIDKLGTNCVVLDDLDIVTPDALPATLGALVASPPVPRVVAACRARPALDDLPGVPAGDAVALGGDDELRFDGRGAAAALAELGVDATDERVEAIQRRVDG